MRVHFKGMPPKPATTPRYARTVRMLEVIDKLKLAGPKAIVAAYGKNLKHMYK